MPVSRADEIAQALWYVAPGRAEVREEKLAARGPGDVRVRALCGALSRVSFSSAATDMIWPDWQ